METPEVKPTEPKKSSTTKKIVMITVLGILFYCGYFYYEKQQADKETAIHELAIADSLALVAKHDSIAKAQFLSDSVKTIVDTTKTK